MADQYLKFDKSSIMKNEDIGCAVHIKPLCAWVPATCSHSQVFIQYSYTFSDNISMKRIANIISDNFQAHIVWLENALSIGVQYVYYVYVHKQARNCKHYKHGHR